MHPAVAARASGRHGHRAESRLQIWGFLCVALSLRFDLPRLCPSDRRAQIVVVDWSKMVRYGDCEQGERLCG